MDAKEKDELKKKIDGFTDDQKDVMKELLGISKGEKDQDLIEQILNVEKRLEKLEGKQLIPPKTEKPWWDVF